MMTASKPRLPEIRARRFDRELDPKTKIENLLSRKEQDAFRSIATVLEYSRAGSTIFAEGEDAHFVYSVAAGVVRISRHSDGGRRQVLALMLPGDLFGLPDAGIYVNTAEVTCPSTLYRIPWAQLRALMAREPAMQHSLFNRVSYDLREAQRRIMVIGQQNTSQRLASLLLDFANHPAFFDDARSIITLPLTRFDIADYLGTSPETVARGLLKLEHDGFIRRVAPRLIQLRDAKGLQDLQRRKRRIDR